MGLFGESMSWVVITKLWTIIMENVIATKANSDMSEQNNQFFQLCSDKLAVSIDSININFWSFTSSRRLSLKVISSTCCVLFTIHARQCVAFESVCEMECQSKLWQLVGCDDDVIFFILVVTLAYPPKKCCVSFNDNIKCLFGLRWNFNKTFLPLLSPTTWEL